MGYRDLMPRFDLRNSNLIYLVSEAAVDIDNYMQGRSQEDASVQYFSKLLNDITQGENPRALLPDISYVLGLAIFGVENREESLKGKKLEDVVLQTNLVSKDLRDFKSLSRDRQGGLMNFCVRLSQEIMSYRNEYYSTPRRHFTETYHSVSSG